MLTVLGVMFGGVVIGYLIRRRNNGWINRAIICLIWILLFLLGVDVGGNRRIIESLYTIGIEAVIITSAALVGSVLAAWALWYWIYKHKESAQ